EPEASTSRGCSRFGSRLVAACGLVVVAPLLGGELLVVLLLHFVLDDGMPGLVSLFRRHVMLARPATHLKLLDQVHLQNAMTHKEPLTRYERLPFHMNG